MCSPDCFFLSVEKVFLLTFKVLSSTSALDPMLLTFLCMSLKIYPASHCITDSSFPAHSYLHRNMLVSHISAKACSDFSSFSTFSHSYSKISNFTVFNCSHPSHLPFNPPVLVPPPHLDDHLPLKVQSRSPTTFMMPEPV